MGNPNQQLNDIKLNRKQYESELRKIQTAVDWDIFERKWFFPKSWDKSDWTQIEKVLSRKISKTNDGLVWEPFFPPYAIPNELYYEYERACEYSLKQREPDIYTKRFKLPQSRACNYCMIVTNSIVPKKCSFCGRELFFMSIPEE